MEENKVAPMTKHTDSSRSTDSGVSGRAQTGAREIRERIGEALIWLLDEKYHDDAANELAPDFAKYAAFYAESECSRLASRVEELEKLIAKQSGCSHGIDSASVSTSNHAAKETR